MWPAKRVRFCRQTAIGSRSIARSTLDAVEHFLERLSFTRWHNVFRYLVMPTLFNELLVAPRLTVSLEGAGHGDGGGIAGEVPVGGGDGERVIAPSGVGEVAVRVEGDGAQAGL